MSSRLIGLFWLIALSLGLAVPCQAQSAGDVDAAVAEIRAELLGASVYASDGPEVGTVTDIDFDDEGEPRRLRMTVAASLGLGARTIEVPANAFIVLRRAVVLDMPADAVESLPEFTGRNGDE
jgi:sporulation protein YlmC with PRC-barrel domain